MTLFGLSPWLFGLGALAFAAGLAALHLLHVRRRRVEVDTLLFFRLAGTLQQPRVLPGRPARWLAYLLALLTALVAWSAVADPRSGLGAKSRMLVVEPDVGTALARNAQLRSLLANGLGPRGFVLAATSPPRLLLRADEPLAALDERAALLAAMPSSLATTTALAAARDQLGADDELVWLGAAPATLAGSTIVHVPVERAPIARLTGLAWQRAENGELTLVVRGEQLPAAELRVADQVLAVANAMPGWSLQRLGPFPPPAAPNCTLVFAGAAPVNLPVPNAKPLRVFAAADLDGELQRAIAAVLAVDGELTAAADARDADVVVAGADDAADARPRLVLTAGVGGGPRQAVPTAEAPLPLTLRDARRRDAAALPQLPAANVWLADAAGGGALAAAVANDDRRRIWIVDWLLLPITHSDTPSLLATSLHELGGRPTSLLAAAGQPLAVPAAFAAPLQIGDREVHAVLGCYRLAPTNQGPVTLTAATGARSLTTVAVMPAAATLAAAVPALAPLGGDHSLSPWLVAALVLLLATDALLFHRGRLP